MTDAISPAAAVPPKVDPETLALRGNPARVTRFKRGAIIAVSGVGATVIAGAAWLALKPVSFGSAVREEDSASVAARPNSEMLAGAPSGYGDVPKLGPPLPGDLGRPILAHRREAETISSGGDVDGAAAQAAQAAEADRQRLAAEQRAARESGVMLQRSQPVISPQPGDYAVSEAASETGNAVAERPDPKDAPRKNAMVGQANLENGTSPHRLVAPVSPWTLQAGSILAASLITGLNSDLPGLVTAQITQNAYDSVTGRTLLLPQGARLVGSYDNVVAFGQSRALVVWQRIILPDGSSIRLDNMPASDTEGYAGLSDRIDRHTWQVLKGVAISTLLGVGTELGVSGESDLVRALRESTQQNTARVGDRLVARNLEVPTTLKVRPGWPLRIVVHRDIILRPWSSGTGGPGGAP